MADGHIAFGARYDDDNGDVFAISIAIDAGAVAVGANHDDDNGDVSGSASLFKTSARPCSVADLAEPLCELNFSDVVAFLTAFGAGCP